MLLPKSIVQATTTLFASLSQTETNGLSLWGSLDAPRLPLYHDPKWQNLLSQRSDEVLNSTIPNTGVTVTYDWTVSRGHIAPDGVNKSVILVNGQFPGPLLEANWGDTIQVTVRNNIGNEGTSLHWHGLLQKGTPYMDGTPGVTQCPIAPGDTFTYSFRADQYGTSWWHSHYSAQYADGLLGPIVINGPTQVSYDIDIGPVMLQDWYHPDYFTVVEHLFTVPPSPLPINNNLINGKMNFNCSALTVDATCKPNAGLSKFSFESGKTHRLRLINSGSEGTQRFSIDGHTLTVIAVDFVPIVPYETDVVTVGVGQRSDIIVNGTGKAGEAYWMRSNYSELCASVESLQPHALAVVYYEDADTNASPNSTAVPYVETNCLNDPLSITVPSVPSTPPKVPDITQTIDISSFINGSGMTLYTLGGISYRADYNEPTLLTVVENSTTVNGNNSNSSTPVSYPIDQNIHEFALNSTVRLIVTNSLSMSHPMHLHGHNFWILAEGNGTWDGTITNPTNPTRRDTFLMDAGGYTVIEYVADNPGVWGFHCHFAGHISLGMYINTLEGVDVLKSEASQITGVLAPTCKKWDAWTKGHVVDEIDSGE